MTSQYPGALDGYQNIRVVRDTIDEVLAKDHNDNRDAIVKIEQTLGINPQGVDGTVSNRLYRVDADFGYHISGTAYRHVTNHIDYPGSAPYTFADGYAMVPSRLGSTLNELVRRLGASTPAGASGGDKIGTTPFTTEHSKYSFPGTSVRSQILTASAALDENATLLERALDAFVVDGMSVAEIWGGTYARVSEGHIVSDGRLLRYNGADLAVPASGTFYAVAKISGGVASVTIEDTTLPSLDPLNPAVLLHKIVRSGGAWTESVDIRRYGLFVNNKNFVSVGATPSSGKDGYGCDFLSLKGAVEHARALAAVDKMVTPRKIVLVNDVGAASDDDLNIVLDVPGMEIDGCGKSLVLNGSFSAPIFLVNANQVRIHDLTTVSLAVTAPVCFAQLGATVSVDDVQIVRCGMKTEPAAAPVDIFLLLGDASGLLTVSDALIANNTVSVANGGIVYLYTTTAYAPILLASKIVGNHIYQDAPASATLPAIQASVECVVSDNIILGGFTIGVSLHAPVDSVVSNNLITGTDFSNVYMTTGIAVWAPGPSGDAFGALIADNTIKGVNDIGISNFMSGGRAARQTIIANNTVDNSGITTFPITMTGIKAYRREVPVVGNKILWCGPYAIQRTGLAVANEIYGNGLPYTIDGIQCDSAGPDAIVCGNRLYDLSCSGSVINANQSDRAIVANNIVRECVTSGYMGAGIYMERGTQGVIAGNVVSHSSNTTNQMWGIAEVGDDSIVCGNVIENQQYGVIETNAAGVSRTSVIGNRAHNCGGWGIYMDSAVDCVIANNFLVIDDAALSPATGIGGFSSYCVVSGNLVKGYAAGGYYGIAGGVGRGTALSDNLVIDLHMNASGAVSMTGGWRDISIVDNVVYMTMAGGSHKGFDLSGSANAVVSGNLLFDSTGSARSGIYRVGQYSVVSNNAILGYGETSGSRDAYGICLMDAYSTAVVGNTIAAGASMAAGIYLDADLGSVDNLIADNILNGLPNKGIDLVSPIAVASLRHMVSNNLIIGTNQYQNTPGIANVPSQTVVVGNQITYPNGCGIEVIGNGSVVGNNCVIEPTGTYGHGIYVYNGPGVSTIFAGLVVGNIVSRNSENNYGIVVGNSWGINVVGNYVYGFSTGIVIAAFDGGSSIDCSVCGNYILQDPVAPIGYAGIYVYNSCTSLSIVGNFIFGPQIGIELYSGIALISSNQIVWYRTVGIDAHGMDELCIASNYVGPPYILTLTADGIDLAGCIKTLVVGNIAYAQNILGFGFGMSFVIDSSQPADGLVMTGNLGRAGTGAPSNGAGGTWSSGWNIDVDCRWIF